MSQTIEQLIYKLKDLDSEEKRIKGLKCQLLSKLKEVDQQLDQNSTKRSLALRELEMVYGSDQSDENDFQSLCSDNTDYPKSSDIDDSDEYSQKRKSRSDSTGSDVEVKKVKSTAPSLTSHLNSVEDINNFDQQMVNQCIDEMANRVINEMVNSDIKLKDDLEKLSEDPMFESMVNDVKRDSQTNLMSQTSQTSLTSLCRSYSTDGNFKENISPSTRVRRSASNRFKFDEQNPSAHRLSDKSNRSPISQSTIVPTNLLRGKKFLSTLLSEKQIIDEKREKSFVEKVEITSKDFKENMFFWEKKTTECLLQNRNGSKIASV